MLINLYIWIVIIAALVSLIEPNPYNKIVQILYRLTEPVLARTRRAIPSVISGIDLSPLIVIVVLKFIDLFFVRILQHYAQNL